jgi:hypothetical protein
MSGSGASNLGYGNIAPLSNINGAFVNVDNSNSPSGFGSTVIPGTPPGPLPGLAGTKDNVSAAAGMWPGNSIIKGGSRMLKKKIKNITKRYKMRHSKRRASRIKTKLRRKYSSKRKRGGVPLFLLRTAYKKMSGSTKKRKGGGYTPPGPPGIPYPPGYGQYQNNVPLTHSYSVGGLLPASESALANPPPIKIHNGGRRHTRRRRHRGGSTCVDNYNHYTNMGFPSRNGIM